MVKHQPHNEPKLLNHKEQLPSVPSQRKTVQKELQKIRELHEALLHSFPNVLIGVIDRGMQFMSLDGRSFDEIDLISNNSRPDTRDILSHLSKKSKDKIKKAFEGKRVNHEIKLRDKFYKVTAIPLPAKEGVEKVLCLIMNISEQKSMEAGLLKSLEKEKEVGELKSRFVTMASHEFRTPLTSILASTFLLENAPTDKDEAEKDKTLHINRIKRSVNNLTAILNEFLSLQKLEENKVSLVYTEVNVPEYIQDDLVSEMEVLKKPDQVLEYKHLGIQSMAHIDHQIFWSIVTNLISNSLKYSRAGAKICITSEIDDGIIKLQVEDPGIGIPDNEHKYIFGRFYRASNALNFEGTGLGLHIVQKYVHLLKGQITFTSRLNEGTRFSVSLPEAKNANEKNVLNITSKA
jgi:signal transduction histidine kinase